ncbi:MAG: hypothetical protein IPL73_19885 [Candidatus Obscuribacter sp.]|nr:hypothetical protein [Candidatus Obscuribacter sp.]
MVEVNSNIELEAAPSLSAAPLRNFKSMVRELAGTSEEAEINRIPVKTAITGDIVALKCDNSITRTGLAVFTDSCGTAASVVHSKMHWRAGAHACHCKIHITIVAKSLPPIAYSLKLVHIRLYTFILSQLCFSVCARWQKKATSSMA